MCNNAIFLKQEKKNKTNPPNKSNMISIAQSFDTEPSIKCFLFKANYKKNKINKQQTKDNYRLGEKKELANKSSPVPLGCVLLNGVLFCQRKSQCFLALCF